MKMSAIYPVGNTGGKDDIDYGRKKEDVIAAIASRSWDISQEEAAESKIPETPRAERILWDDAEIQRIVERAMKEKSKD